MKSNLITTLFLLAFLWVSSARASGYDAQQNYDNIQGPELTLERTVAGGPIIGVEITQKTDAFGDFCRKSVAVAPSAQPEYNCYYEITDGDEARNTYLTAYQAEFNVMFYEGDSPILGEHWAEKEIVSNRFGDAPILCVERSAIAPGAQNDYRCYSPNLPPIGGGVSVGN